jgi:hypothetical protein
MPGGKVAQVYADGRYWVETGEGVKELDPVAAGPIRANVQRDVVSVLVKTAAGKLVVRDVDSDDPDVGALEITGDGMEPLTLFINRTNGLIEKARYMSGTEGRAEEVYSDYRNVGGIQVPFHTVVRRAGLTVIEREVKTIRFNVPLPPALFHKQG